jgi:hypothetical protein
MPKLIPKLRYSPFFKKGGYHLSPKYARGGLNSFSYLDPPLHTWGKGGIQALSKNKTKNKTKNNTKITPIF